MVTLVNRAKMTTATTGTGTVTLGSAVDSYQTYASAGVTDGDVTRNVFEDGDAWEISTGTYTALGSTLTRTLVESSTGSLLNLSGEAVVYVSAIGQDIVQPSDLATVATSGSYSDLTGLPAPCFAYNAVSGATQALDVGSFNFFDAGTLTADTTISFTGVPTEAKWTYTAEGAGIAPWSVETASYDSVSFSVSGQDGSPAGIFFKDDGTKMYMVGFGSDAVHQYSLSTAWDLSTASYDSVNFSVSGQDGGPQGISFKPDGTKMYMVGFGSAAAHQYSLSTAWDLSTASYDSVNFSVSGQDSAPAGISFKPDGTKMYVSGYGSDAVHQYSLSTAWNLSTASYDSVSFSVASQDDIPRGIFFKDDGTKMYMVGSSNDRVHQYSLSTAWNLSTTSYDSVNFSVLSQETNPTGIFFKDDGTKMYMVGLSNDRVHQYSTLDAVTITLPASVQNPPTAPITPSNRIAYTFFTADGGTNVYLISEEVL